MCVYTKKRIMIRKFQLLTETAILFGRAVPLNHPYLLSSHLFRLTNVSFGYRIIAYRIGAHMHCKLDFLYYNDLPL